MKFLVGPWPLFLVGCKYLHTSAVYLRTAQESNDTDASVRSTMMTERTNVQVASMLVSYLSL